MSEVPWAHVVRDSDRRMFKRCRRQWELGARARRNLEPVRRPPIFDVGEALRAGLAVYYFPGMWDWDRSVVERLALQGYWKSTRAQREAAALVDAAGDDARERWDEGEELGSTLLGAYFTWAPTVDAFTPVRVETDFEVGVPDPDEPDRDLLSADGRPVRFRGRIDMLVVDEDDAYWIAQHRFVEGDWLDVDHLVLEEEGVTACWAWELFFLGMRIAGVVYNELRAVDEMPQAPRPSGERPSVGIGHRRMYAQAAREPATGIVQRGDAAFRRTTIPRSRTILDAAGRRLADEVLDMTHPAVRVYPNPSPASCGPCRYRAPCIATDDGAAEEILAADYRTRRPELEEGRLGGVTWSMNRGAAPPRFRGSADTR